MAQDLRDLLKTERQKKHTLKAGHEDRFAKRLDRELHGASRKPWYLRLGIAAAFVILLGLGILVLRMNQSTVQDANTQVAGTETDVTPISLGNLSPDLKKIEQYYVANINMELAGIEISPENKAVVDSFMERLSVLNVEYEELNKELNAIGPNDQTITALIKNLQIRLQLLHKLKEKMHLIKTTEHETETTNSI